MKKENIFCSTCVCVCDCVHIIKHVSNPNLCVGCGSLHWGEGELIRRMRSWFIQWHDAFQHGNVAKFKQCR
mgnify:CR=1 FL=1